MPMSNENLKEFKLRNRIAALEQDKRELLGHIKNALAVYGNMTTLEFSNGADKEIRETLAALIERMEAK